MRYFAALTSILLLLMAAPHSATAREEGEVKASSYGTAADEPEVEAFRIIILGTRSGPDIEIIRKNMEKLAYVSVFVPSSVSQRRIEFEGRFTGPDDVLIADIESLSQDRYEVKTRRDDKRGLVITLKKIEAQETYTE